MRYQQLGNTDLNVSAVGLGTWAIGGDFWGPVDDTQSIDAIRAAIDSGINLIDTAPAYGAGHAEKIVGKAIKGRRDNVIIATKCGIVRTKTSFIRHLKPASIRQEIEDSLSLLGVDVIDLYQIHWPDKNTPLEETLSELIKLRDAGKFRYLGLSNFTPDLINEVMSVTEVVSLQPQYSLLTRDIEQEILPFCRANNLGVLSYGSLAGGLLTGKYRTQPTFAAGDNRSNFYPFFKEPLWSKAMGVLTALETIAQQRNKPIGNVAINWAAQQQGITCALVGARTPKQAEENASAGQWELSDIELQAIEDAYQKFFGDL